MNRQILILTITILLFIWNRLSLDRHRKTRCDARAGQDKVYGAAFYAIEHFGEQPDEENEHKAKIALDKAREASLSKNRENILQSDFQDLERCYQDERESRKKVNHDMNLAIQAHTMSR